MRSGLGPRRSGPELGSLAYRPQADIILHAWWRYSGSGICDAIAPVEGSA
jgi:hypothetical protein